MEVRRVLILVCALLFSLLFLTSRPAFADCSDLTTADPGELLSIPDSQFHLEELPASVSCTWSDLEAPPALCEKRIGIVEDRMVDSRHRMIVSHRRAANIEPNRPRNLSYFFACVDGQVKQTSSAVAGYERTEPERETIACNDLRDASAARLVAVATNGWFQLSHGFGIYDGGEWDVTMKLDRMIGDDQRLIQVHRNHLRGSGAPDAVMVFACVSGKIKDVFNVDFGPYGVNISKAGGGRVVIPLPIWRGMRGFSRSETRVATYTWRPGLGRYILTDIRVSPLRPERAPLMRRDSDGVNSGGGDAHKP